MWEAGSETTGGKGNGPMRTQALRIRLDEITPSSRQRAERIPELRSWREVGWIFRDGDTLAIERQGQKTRTRLVSLSHLSEA